MYSFLAGQILCFTLYLISTIFSTRFRLFEIGRSERNHFLLWMLDFFVLLGIAYFVVAYFFTLALGDWWWDGENWHAIDDFVLVLGKGYYFELFSYIASAFSVSYSFSVPSLSTVRNHIAQFPGFVVSLSRLNYPSLVRLAHHTKRSSHKLAASIVVVAVAAVEEDLRNPRCGSFYSADDFYRGVPSPSVRLLRASYSMTSW